MRFSRRSIIVSASVVAVAALVTGVVAASSHPAAKPATSHIAVATPTPMPTPYVAPSAAAVAALPEAKYNAVIPGLVAYVPPGTPVAAQAVYKISADAPLYAANRTTPVARFAALNFLKQPSVIVPAQSDGPWTLVLTPARVDLPSKHPDAPAQSAGWIRTSLLTKVQTLSSHILVSLDAQTVSIVNAQGKTTATFPAGVGAKGTPTPTNVTGYMEARYLDPAQGQTVYPIGLTSLHSSAADEPFGGHDGGLIGIHYEAYHSGDISHGCVRLDGASITALDQLPLGTSVIIEK